MPNILDKRFKYVPAASTDLRKTFARVRREQAKRQQHTASHVTPLRGKR